MTELAGPASTQPTQLERKTGQGQPSRALVVAALLAVYLVWGATYLGNNVALESFPPLILTASRFGLAGFLLLGLATLRGADLRLTWITAAGVALPGLFLIGVGSSLLAFGQLSIPSGLSSLMIASTPLWVLLFEAASGRQPTKLALTGVLLGFAGLAALVATSVGLAGSTSGLFVLLCATLAWAMGSVVSPRMRMPTDGLVSAGWQMVIGATAVAMASTVAGEVFSFRLKDVTGRSWLAWTLLSLGSTAVGFGCYAWLLRTTSLRLATTYAYVNPVVAVLLGSVVLGERLEGWQLPAAALVLVAVAAVVAAERPPAARSTTALPCVVQPSAESASTKGCVNHDDHPAGSGSPAST